MGLGENLSTGKISAESFRKAILLSILIIVGYGLFTIIFRNDSNVINGVGDFLLPVISATTLIVVFFAVKRSKTYSEDYFHAWLLLLISQILWVLGDVLWSLWDLNLVNSSFLSYNYIFFGLRTVFLCLGLYLMPKPQVEILTRYSRVTEIGMVLVTFTMFFWSFMILPFNQINHINYFNFMVLALNILSIFALMFFSISLLAFHAGNLGKGPVPYLLFNTLFQVLAAIIYAYQYILGLYPVSGIENLFWIAASLSMILASLVQISRRPPKVLEDLSTDFWRFKVPFESNIALILGLITYLLLLWGYYNYNDVFEVLLFGGGFLVGLAIIRAAINNREIRKSYKKLEESKETYLSILNTINDAVYIINPHMELLKVNQGVLDMYGYDKQEILGKSLEMLSASGKNDMEKIVNSGYQAMGGEPQTFEFWGMRKNGEVFPNEIKLNKGTYFGQDVVVAVARDITHRKEDEKRLKRSLDEKEALVQEVHHRVKNNMQVISSLLGLQSMYLEDGKVQSALQESQNRVHSMAMAHEKLYQSKNLSSVNIKEYLNEIMQYLLSNYQMDSYNIKVDIQAEQVEIDIKTAAPLGLIINELLTNSLKYAFPNNEGKITLKVCLINDCYHLIIADNGVGLPSNFKLDQTKTLGLQIVNQLVRQIYGSIELGKGKGTEFIIKFPAKLPEGITSDK